MIKGAAPEGGRLCLVFARGASQYPDLATIILYHKVKLAISMTPALEFPHDNPGRREDIEEL
jgi:hypothetical protein